MLSLIFIPLRPTALQAETVAKLFMTVKRKIAWDEPETSNIEKLQKLNAIMLVN